MTSTLHQIRATAGAGFPVLWKVIVEAGSTVQIPVPSNTKMMTWNIGNGWKPGPVNMVCPVGAVVRVAVYFPDAAHPGSTITFSALVDGFSLVPTTGTITGTVVVDKFNRLGPEAPINTEAMRQAFFADLDPDTTEKALDWLQAGNTLGDLLLNTTGGISGSLDPTQFFTVDGLSSLDPVVLFKQFALGEALSAQAPTNQALWFGYDMSGGSKIPLLMTAPTASLPDLTGYVTTAALTSALSDYITTATLASAVAASKVVSVVTKTANYTVTASDDVILVDTTGGAVTITMRTAVGVTKTHTIKLKAGSNPLTILRTASETIEGATSIVTSKLGESLTLCSDNANWFVI